MESNKELEDFRKQWKVELNREGSEDKPNCDKNLTDKTDTTKSDNSVFGVEESRLRPNTYQSFLLAEDLLKQNDSQIHETYSNNVLRRKRSSSNFTDLNTSIASDTQKISPRSKAAKCDENESASSTKERFLDIFLADLDEINEIPFFDIDLPRELALNIFRHLDVKDLCRCANVSRAWRSLAEDEVLWLGLSHRYGYNKEQTSTDELNWKGIFREKLVRQQLITSNWKSRTGTFHEYSYPGGGVLCAAHSYQDYIVAGYTSGEVKFWNTENGDECLFQPSCKALEINEEEEAGTSANHVTCVHTNQSVTVAGYSQGYIDLWSNETGTAPIHSFRGPGPVKLVELCDNQLLVVNNNIVRVESGTDGCWAQSKLLELPTKVKQASFLKRQAQHSQHIVTACLDHLTINSTNNDDITTVHNTIGQYVTMFDIDDALILYATNCYMEPVAKLELYDVCATRSVCRIDAHAGQVTCMNLRHSPQQMFVTGGYDRKAMIHDTRVNTTVMTFNRLNSLPHQVQMDDYKVVCGLESGMVCVYDQRTTNKLWEFHNRHPVEYMYFKEHLLITANIPRLKFPQLQPHEEVDNIKHRRHRGNVQVYNFLAEQTTQGIEDICLSTYDEPAQYNYNIRLAVPYDNL